MPASPKNPLQPLPTAWRRSTITSVAVHAGVLGALWVGGGPWLAKGSKQRPVPPAHLEFVRLDEPPPPYEDPPVEQESELQEEELQQEATVVPVPFEPEPADPDLELERVELLPDPLARIDPDLWPERAPTPPPPAVTPSEPAPAPTHAEEEAPETPEPTIGDTEGDEALPRPIAGACPDPPYPPRAIVRRMQGVVVCRITVGADGRVVAVVVEESSGYGMLDRAAEEALADWRFEPALRAGQPVQMDVWKRIVFRLP